jgi:hypothetical protein
LAGRLASFIHVYPGETMRTTKEALSVPRKDLVVLLRKRLFARWKGRTGEIQALVGRLAIYIQAHPGETMGTIKNALGATRNDLVVPAKELIAEGTAAPRGRSSSLGTFPCRSPLLDASPENDALPAQIMGRRHVAARCSMVSPVHGNRTGHRKELGNATRRAAIPTA